MTTELRVTLSERCFLALQRVGNTPLIGSMAVVAKSGATGEVLGTQQCGGPSLLVVRLLPC